MTQPGVLQQSQRRRSAQDARARRSRRRRRIRTGAALIVIALGLMLGLMTSGMNDSASQRSASAAGGSDVATAATPQRVPLMRYGALPAAERVDVHFRTPPRSGLLFDVRSGHFLWRRAAARSLPIASLTKLMTALVVLEHARLSDKVLITRDALNYSGSGVGLLPLGRHVRLVPLLYGLLLPSGNDAAIALADHVAGTQKRFVAMMNDRARAMGLRCTHFSSVSGIVDRGNYSCAEDLAALAHAVLEQPLLARIVSSRSAVLPFPIKGGRLFLYNNNPLMFLGYRGIDGLKTGYTVAAGSCLVAAARRGRAWYGVVLLHSVNTAAQAERLLNRAFASA